MLPELETLAIYDAKANTTYDVATGYTKSYNHQRQKLQPVLPKAATSHKKSFDPLVKSFGR